MMFRLRPSVVLVDVLEPSGVEVGRYAAEIEDAGGNVVYVAYGPTPEAARCRARVVFVGLAVGGVAATYVDDECQAQVDELLRLAGVSS